MGHEYQKSSTLQNVLVLGVIILCIVFVFKSCTGSSSGDVNKKFSQLTSSDQKDYLYSMAIDTVKSRLKSPDSAKFPTINEFDVTNNNDEYTISSYVDSQNSFGTMIRTNFSIKVKVNDDSNTDGKGYSYTIEQCQIE